jgi:hypothetical protein
MLYLLIPAMSFWNRFRGAGWVPNNKYLAWPLLGALLFLITGDWLWTLIVTVGVFPEFKLSWGQFLSMNRRGSTPNDGTTGFPWAGDDPRWNIWYVKLLHKLSGGDDYRGTFLRHLFISTYVCRFGILRVPRAYGSCRANFTTCPSLHCSLSLCRLVD